MTLSGREAVEVATRVGQLMREANALQSVPGQEDARLQLLRAAKDIILEKNPDLIDNFWKEMTDTSKEKPTSLVIFCLEWMREACGVEPSYLRPTRLILLDLLEHQSAIVQKQSLMTTLLLYMDAYRHITLPSTKEKDAEVVWTELAEIKKLVISPLEIGGFEFAGMHLAKRLLTYKFIESVIMCQSPRDPSAPIKDDNDDRSSSLDIPSRLHFTSREKVEAEGIKLLQILEDCLMLPQPEITYIDRESICGCLFHLAKRRPQFLSRVISKVEFLNTNIPRSINKVGTESLRKFFRASLITILRRSDDGDILARIADFLATLGVTPLEINRIRPKLHEALNQKRPATTPESSPIKRQKTEGGSEGTSSDLVGTDLQALAMELNTKAVLSKLTPQKVLKLLRSNLTKVPTKMPGYFTSVYTPIGRRSDEEMVQMLARRMAEQMVAASVGPGPTEIARRKQEEQSLANLMKNTHPEDADAQPITSVLTRGTSLTAVRQDEMEDDGEASDEEKPTVISDHQETPEVFKATDRAFHVNEITDPIPKDDRGNAILSIVNELISNDGNVLNACGEYLYHKCLIRFAVKVGIDALRDRIMKYILEDIGTRAELAFRWIYEEYALARQMKRDPNFELPPEADELQRYDDCLSKFIRGFIDHAEYREGLVSALYLEVPLITNGAIDLLHYYCAERSLHGAMRLIQKLVTARPNSVQYITPALEMTLHQRKDLQTQAVQTCVKIYDSIPELRETIKDYAVESIKLLNDPLKPPSWFFTEKFGRGAQLEDYAWTEEYQKLCTTLFTGLLSEDPTFLPTLGEIYVKHPSDVKKTIFKVIEQPMKAIGMNAPEVLLFVRNPPPGSESLVLRIIHLLTETHPPTTELISSIRSLYTERIPDVRFLIPILSGLPKDDILAALPKLIKLNPALVQEVFHRLLGTGKHKHDATQRKPAVTPAEVFIELHKIDLTKADAQTLMKATGLCLAEKDMYPQDTMVYVLKTLIETEPLPFLLMRTILQTLTMYPQTRSFIMNILQRLISKEVWNIPVLWDGFVKCCEKTVPQSFPVLLMIPAEKLLPILEKNPVQLKAGLKQHVATMNFRQRALMNPRTLSVVEYGTLELPEGLEDRNAIELVAVINPLPNENGQRRNNNTIVLKIEDTPAEEETTSASSERPIENGSDSNQEAPDSANEEEAQMYIKMEDSDDENPGSPLRTSSPSLLTTENSVE